MLLCVCVTPVTVGTGFIFKCFGRCGLAECASDLKVGLAPTQSPRIIDPLQQVTPVPVVREPTTTCTAAVPARPRDSLLRPHAGSGRAAARVDLELPRRDLLPPRAWRDSCPLPSVEARARAARERARRRVERKSARLRAVRDLADRVRGAAVAVDVDALARVRDALERRPAGADFGPLGRRVGAVDEEEGAGVAVPSGTREGCVGAHALPRRAAVAVAEDGRRRRVRWPALCLLAGGAEELRRAGRGGRSEGVRCARCGRRHRYTGTRLGPRARVHVGRARQAREEGKGCAVRVLSEREAVRQDAGTELRGGRPHQDDLRPLHVGIEPVAAVGEAEGGAKRAHSEVGEGDAVAAPRVATAGNALGAARVVRVDVREPAVAAAVMREGARSSLLGAAEGGSGESSSSQVEVSPGVSEDERVLALWVRQGRGEGAREWGIPRRGNGQADAVGSTIERRREKRGQCYDATPAPALELRTVRPSPAGRRSLCNRGTSSHWRRRRGLGCLLRLPARRSRAGWSRPGSKEGHAM